MNSLKEINNIVKNTSMCVLGDESMARLACITVNMSELSLAALQEHFMWSTKTMQELQVLREDYKCRTASSLSRCPSCNEPVPAKWTYAQERCASCIERDLRLMEEGL